MRRNIGRRCGGAAVLFLLRPNPAKWLMSNDRLLGPARPTANARGSPTITSPPTTSKLAEACQ